MSVSIHWLQPSLTVPSRRAASSLAPSSITIYIRWRVSGGPPDIVWLSTDGLLAAADVVSGLVVASLVDRRQPTKFLLSGHWQLAHRTPTAHHQHCFLWHPTGRPLATH